MKSQLETKELVTEFLWFQRFISENDLKTEIEIEGDELVVYMPSRKTPLKLDAVEAKRIRTEVLTDATKSRMYTDYILKGPLELGEKVIATDATQSRLYARDVLKSRFELGEPAITTDAVQLWLYNDFLATLI